MPRPPIPTWFFVLVVVRRDDRYLLVQEAKPLQGWYLPAGGVEPAEGLLEAARREVLEEAGVPIEPEGVLRVEHGVRPDGTTRVRVFLVARPGDDSPPKAQPDGESLGAAWVTLDDLRTLPLRSPEAREVIEYVARGGAVHPLDVLAREGDRFGTIDETTRE